MIDWITVMASRPAAYSSCALPGGLLAIAVTMPQIAATPARATTTYAKPLIIDVLGWSPRRSTLPEHGRRPVRLGTCGDWCLNTGVEEEQWPPSESPRLAGARATRTPEVRSSPLRGRRSRPRASQVHQFVLSQLMLGSMRR